MRFGPVPRGEEVLTFDLSRVYYILHLDSMASSEVLNSVPSNGHINNVEDADNSVVHHLQHEDTSAKQGVSETGLQEVHTEPHDEPRSAQLEGTVQSPVLDNPTASQRAAPSSKVKPTGSPIKPSPPTSQTTTGKAPLSGPPTPQVKKVLASFVICDTVLCLFFSDTTTTCCRF
jgi:hypothetical protein